MCEPKLQWLGLTIVVAVYVLFGCEDKGTGQPDPLGEETHLALNEVSWPVYSGPCFLFQAPETLDVYWRRWGTEVYDFSIEIYEEGERDELLLELTPSGTWLKGRERHGVKMRVGGMDAWFFQEYEENDTYNGSFVVELPEVSPSSVKGRFRKLTGVQRDLAFQIFSSLRYEPVGRDLEGVPVHGHSEIELHPVVYSVNFAENPYFCSW